MNDRQVPCQIRLGQHKWWTGSAWTSIRAFAGLYTADAAFRLVARRWPGGARSRVIESRAGDFYFARPEVVIASLKPNDFIR